MASRVTARPNRLSPSACAYRLALATAWFWFHECLGAWDASAYALPAKASRASSALSGDAAEGADGALVGKHAAACPCDNPRLCNFVTHQHQREFIGFFWPYSQPIDLFDWTQITAVAWAPPDRPDLMCAAHAARARVLLNAGDVSGAIADEAARKQWISQQVKLAKAHWMDGMNFDWEVPAKMGSAASRNYTRLVRDTARAFKEFNPHAQVSVDVPWAAFGNDGRDYDYTGLAEAADLLFVMSYDMQAQVFSRCVAAANSPLAQVQKGLQQYLDLGISPHKLALGVAWYGYDYPCQPDARGVAAAPDADLCVLSPVEYRGAPCSDAAGGQRDHRDLMAQLRSGANTTSLVWDPLAQSPRYNYVDGGGQVHQVWLETPESLVLRYRLARDLGLKGVGAWNLGCLEHSATGDPAALQDTAAMWQAVKTFTVGSGGGAAAVEPAEEAEKEAANKAELAANGGAAS